MNYKKRSIIFFAIIFALGLCIFLSLYMYIGGGKKEIKAAKRFIDIVYSNDIVDKGEDLDKISYTSNVKSQIATSDEYYNVTTKDFSIDVDSDYKIVGFNNNVCKLGERLISEDEAEKLAEKYLSRIYKGEYEYKGIVDDNTEKIIPYYTLVFTKMDDGYPYYSDQIVVGINKSTGKMDNYLNGIYQKKHKRVNVDKTVEEAKNIAINAFNNLYKDGNIIEEPYLAFCDDKDKENTQLCYVVSVSGKDEDGKDTVWKYFVSSDKGKIINNIKENVANTKAIE